MPKCRGYCVGYFSTIQQKTPQKRGFPRNKVAGWTGLEPATSGVTGRRSNQLSYHPFALLGRAEPK